APAARVGSGSCMRTCDGGRLLACARIVALALVLPRPSLATSLTRGPYLQLLTRQSVTVVWNTDAPAACALPLRPLDGVPTVRIGGSGTVCAVAADGLSPGTQYAYVPLADGAPLAAESVFTTDDPSRPFSFLVLGDSGCDCSDQLAVRDAMLK